MKWFDTREELEYYNPPPDMLECYCETMPVPQDLMLQGDLQRNGTPTFTYLIRMYDPSGTTLLDTVTGSFDIYIGLNPITNKQYFAARLKTFTPSMCANPCFVLEVTISKGGIFYFYGWTQKYCIPSCCLYATNITVIQNGVTEPPIVNPSGGSDTPTVNIGSDGTFINDCGTKYYRFETWSDCYNPFSGKYYVTPTTVQGSAFPYRNVTYIKGRVYKLPDEILRQYSRNCRLQQVELQRMYEIRGYEIYPRWKMQELTEGFGDKYIYFGGKRYEAEDITPFEPIQITNDCEGHYRLKATVNDCTLRQILGCNETCGENSRGFIVGKSLMPNPAYYSENRQYIGTTCDDILNYYRTRQGIISVTAVDPDLYDCDYECAFLVQAMPDAPIPNSFYFGIPQAQNRNYGIPAEQLADLCSIVTPICAVPVLGTIEVVPTVCATPVLGTITIVTPVPETLSFVPIGDWTLQATTQSITKESGTVVMTFDIHNDNYPYGGSGELPFINENVILIGEGGRPSGNRLITSAENGDIPVGASITIQTNGYLTYSGNPTSADGTGSDITIANLTWQI